VKRFQRASGLAVSAKKLSDGGSKLSRISGHGDNGVIMAERNSFVIDEGGVGPAASAVFFVFRELGTVDSHVVFLLLWGDFS
jgi:hypothetical protein